MNWNKAKVKIVAIWGIIGGTVLSGLGIFTNWSVNAAKKQFEVYVQEIVLDEVELVNSHKKGSLSYKLSKEFKIDREEVPNFLADNLRVLRENNDSIVKFNKTLKPWAIDAMRVVIVGPNVKNGKWVYTDFDGEDYRIRIDRNTQRAYWIDGEGKWRFVRPSQQ